MTPELRARNDSVRRLAAAYLKMEAATDMPEAIRLALRQRNRTAREAAVIDYSNQQMEKRKRGRREARLIGWRLRDEVLSSGPCAYCGDIPTEVDHIVPASKGGTRRRRNLAPACKPCNREKLDFTPEEWKAYRIEIGEPWPPTSRFASLLDMLRVEAERAGITFEHAKELYLAFISGGGDR